MSGARRSPTALEALGAYYGADITVEDGDLNDETQVKQIENMIANNVDIMMIDPTTPDGHRRCAGSGCGSRHPDHHLRRLLG